MNRTSPAGLLRFANEYARAAMIVADANDRLHNPSYFLAGHSIELSLKAFLLKRGVPYTDLRSPRRFGHNLVALLVEARRRKIGREVAIDRSVDRQIPVLNEMYASKRFEYIVTGAYTVPHLDHLTWFAVHLATGLRGYCAE
jgi:hypothetical protein